MMDPEPPVARAVDAAPGYAPGSFGGRAAYLDPSANRLATSNYLVSYEVHIDFLHDKLAAKLGSHTLEVRADNHILRGLIYKLLVDGEEVAGSENFFKIPTQRTLEARVYVDGTERRTAVSVKQRMFSADYSLTVDGELVPLEPVK